MKSALQNNLTHKQDIVSLHNIPVSADICWNAPLVVRCLEYLSLAPESAQNSCLNMAIDLILSAIQMLFQFPEHVKIEGRLIGTLLLLKFSEAVKPLQPPSNHNDWKWLCVLLIYFRFFTLNICSPEGFCQQKTVLFYVLQRWSKFPIDAPFPSRATQQRLSQSEWNCYHWKTWNWIIICASFSLVSQLCHPWRKCLTLFLNAHCILFDKIHIVL